VVRIAEPSFAAVDVDTHVEILARRDCKVG
jgi:hypothetical protein